MMKALRVCSHVLLLGVASAAGGGIGGVMRSERAVLSVAADGTITGSSDGDVRPHERAQGDEAKGIAELSGGVKEGDADAIGTVESFLETLDSEQLRAHEDLKASVGAAMDKAFDHQVLNAWAWPVDDGSITNYIRDKLGDRFLAMYAETDPNAIFSLITEKLRLRPTNPPRKFYELGSGFGKIASYAWLLGFDSTGVEIAAERVNVACDKVKQLPHKPLALAEGASNHLRMIQGDASSVDFSDADVVYVDATTWNKTMLKAEGLTASRMRPGSFVVTNQVFPGSNLKVVGEIVMPSTWGADSKWHIQKVMPGGPAALAEDRAAHYEKGVKMCERRTLRRVHKK